MVSCYGKKYGTIPKTMELRLKREKKPMVDYPKRRNFDLLWKKLW